MTDSIADMLTQIRNAQAVKKPEINIPYSRMKFEVAMILKKEGYVEDVKAEEKDKLLKIVLKYLDNEIVIRRIERISKSGQRVYVGSKEIKRVMGGLGISVISTSQGLMTGKEARKRNLGGEIICEVF